MRDNTVSWSGYEFTVFCYDHGFWSPIGGLYIFARLTENDVWKPLYIGKAKSFWNRINFHEKWPDVKRHGVTHIHLRPETYEADRVRIEYELILKYKPPLNVQLKF